LPPQWRDPPYFVVAVAPELRNCTIRRPYHSQRSQILINLAPSVTKLIKAVPGELPEIMCRLQRGSADLNRGIRFRTLKQPKHSFRPKMRSPVLAFGNALGHNQQLCPRFKCQHDGSYVRWVNRPIGAHTFGRTRVPSESRNTAVRPPALMYARMPSCKS
jgi:hypothetical protein